MSESKDQAIDRVLRQNGCFQSAITRKVAMDAWDACAASYASRQSEQWMKDAAQDIANAACQFRTYQIPEKIVGIIAKYAPESPSPGEYVAVDEISAVEQLIQQSSSSKEAPTCPSCGTAMRCSNPKCHRRFATIRHKSEAASPPPPPPSPASKQEEPK